MPKQKRVRRSKRLDPSKKPVTEKTTMSARGYIIPKSTLSPAEVINIKRALEVSPFVPRHVQRFSGRPPRFKVFLESKSRLYLPRYYGLEKYGPADKTAFPSAAPWPDNLRFNGTLRANQQEPMQALLMQFATTGGGLLCVRPGHGKTVMALWAAGIFKRKVAVVVHTTALLEQWVDRIKGFVPGARVGIIQGAKFEYDDNDFVVIMLQTLYKKDWPPNARNKLFRFGLLIVDECHHIAAQSFSKALLRIGARYTLGLTATPKRDDRLSFVFKWFLGDIAYESKTEDRIAKVYCVTLKGIQKKEEIRNKQGRLNTQAMLSELCADKRRTRWIANKAVECWKSEGRYVMILTHRCQHVYDIAEEIERHPDSENCMYVEYLGGSKNEVLEGADIIIATYSMAEEGLDVPRLNTLIYATPKKSMNTVQQSSGRILRALNPELIPEIYDIHDGYSVFKRWAVGRGKYYKECNWNVEKLGVDCRVDCKVDCKVD